jgi:uncharacterized membrane protein YkgB
MRLKSKVDDSSIKISQIMIIIVLDYCSGTVLKFILTEDEEVKFKQDSDEYMSWLYDEYNLRGSDCEYMVVDEYREEMHFVK